MSQTPNTLPQTTQTQNPRRVLTRLALALVRFYQRRISPLKPPTCRFQPTCSEYARQALIKYGAVKGSALALRRIARCHPFHPGGYDPLP